VATLLDFARSHAVGHIVVGRPRGRHWRSLLGRDFVQRMVREGDGFDVHVVGSRDAAEGP
jgi:two-component system sensor histidine kinase KdpD